MLNINNGWTRQPETRFRINWEESQMGSQRATKSIHPYDTYRWLFLMKLEVIPKLSHFHSHVMYILMISPLLLGKSPFRVVSSVSSHKNRSFPIQPMPPPGRRPEVAPQRPSTAGSSQVGHPPESPHELGRSRKCMEMSNPSRGRTTWLSWVHKLRNGPLLLYSWLID